MQNPISNNTNVLRNSPSLEKNTAIGYLWFYKTTPFLSFKGKKAGQSHLFFLVQPFTWDASKTAKNQWICIVFNFNQIRASLFQCKFKSIFPTKSVLLPFTFNQHFFSFQLCPIGSTLTYSVQ